jgi:putative hydrolase of the HAD superfamily
MAELKAVAATTWMIGDNLEWDVGAPQRLGLTGVWVDGPGLGLPAGSAVTPHHIVRSFGGLLSV